MTVPDFYTSKSPRELETSNPWCEIDRTTPSSKFSETSFSDPEPEQLTRGRAKNSPRSF